MISPGKFLAGSLGVLARHVSPRRPRLRLSVPHAKPLRAERKSGERAVRHGIHFITGMPRSGSTLLAGILRQNPRFHAMMSSPLAAIYMHMQAALSARNEGALFLTEEQKRDLLRGVFDNYYRSIGAEKVVFDTNRMWCSRMPHIAEHFPDAKVIACVREIAWIMDSFERLAQRNIYDLSGIYGFDAGGTVYTRTSKLATSAGLVGYALDAVKEAFFGGHGGRLMLVSYEALTRDPEATLGIIYRFIGEKPFTHDFDNVDYEEEQFDSKLGAPGLHRVRRKVQFEERQTVLPPDLFQRFAADDFWTREGMNPHGVPVVRWLEDRDAESAKSV